MFWKLQRQKWYLKFLDLKYNWLSYRISDFITNWIFPAYKLLRVFGIDRYDIASCAPIGRFEYSDCPERLRNVNFNLLVQYVDQEKPFEYICWDNQFLMEIKKDFLNSENFLKDTYDFALDSNGNKINVGDLIKDTYDYIKVRRPILSSDYDLLLHYWCELSHGKIDRDHIEEYVSLLEKYIDKDKWFDHNFVFNKLHILEALIDQSDLDHLIIIAKIRPYLWT